MQSGKVKMKMDEMRDRVFQKLKGWGLRCSIGR